MLLLSELRSLWSPLRLLTSRGLVGAVACSPDAKVASMSAWVAPLLPPMVKLHGVRSPRQVLARSSGRAGAVACWPTTKAVPTSACMLPLPPLAEPGSLLSPPQLLALRGRPSAVAGSPLAAGIAPTLAELLLLPTAELRGVGLLQLVLASSGGTGVAICSLPATEVTLTSAAVRPSASPIAELRHMGSPRLMLAGVRLDRCRPMLAVGQDRQVAARIIAVTIISATVADGWAEQHPNRRAGEHINEPVPQARGLGSVPEPPSAEPDSEQKLRLVLALSGHLSAIECSPQAKKPSRRASQWRRPSRPPSAEPDGMQKPLGVLASSGHTSTIGWLPPAEQAKRTSVLPSERPIAIEVQCSMSGRPIAIGGQCGMPPLSPLRTDPPSNSESGPRRVGRLAHWRTPPLAAPLPPPSPCNAQPSL